METLTVMETQVDDPFALQRFVDAQEEVYLEVLRELREGRKRSHWMWFIFPQVEGLGQSAMSRMYAIGSLEEAQEYARHPVLGARLIECATLITRFSGRSIQEILGQPDDMKFRSSMTLFALAAPKQLIFDEALAKYFGGERDPMTVARLRR